MVVVDSDFLLIEWRVFGWLGDLDVSWDGIGGELCRSVF